MKLDLLNRTITAAVMVALAIALGVWLTHVPLTAAPVKIAPEPILAPPLVTPTVIEVPIEVEIADPTEPSATKPKPESKPTYSPCRRGLFRHR